jgi:hypothetical protein
LFISVTTSTAETLSLREETKKTLSDKNWENDLVVTRDRCTTIAIGKDATSDGSTYATDTNDCHDCDWRMAKVPAMDWSPNSFRPIYTETSSYPRFVREDRGETWKENNLENVPQKEGRFSSSLFSVHPL